MRARCAICWFPVDRLALALHADSVVYKTSRVDSDPSRDHKEA